MRRFQVVVHVDRQVAERAEEDIQVIILRRSGGGSDAELPRYYMGSGKTRDWAMQQAFQACREHGNFDPVLTPAKTKAR
jgi:hypothetical protein